MRLFLASAVLLCPVLLNAGQPHGYLRKVVPMPVRFAESLPPPPLVNEEVLALDRPKPPEEPLTEIEEPPVETAKADPAPEPPVEPAVAANPDPPIQTEPAPAETDSNEEAVAPIFPEVRQATITLPTNEPELLSEITAILGGGSPRKGGTNAGLPDTSPTTHGGVRPRMVIPLNVFTPPEPVSPPNTSGAVYRKQ